jgi:gas vesicle protein
MEACELKVGCRRLKDFWLREFPEFAAKIAWCALPFVLIISLQGRTFAIFEDSSFFAAIVGALVGGLFAWWVAHYSTNKAHRNQLAKIGKDEKDQINALLQSIHDEIKTVSDRYGETLAPVIERLKEGEKLQHYYPLGGDYFTVYNNNAHLLGERKKPGDLSRLF